MTRGHLIADELLDARVEAGWTPIPTSTVDGEIICPPGFATSPG